MPLSLLTQTPGFQVDKRLADFSASLDIPAQFSALHSAMDALQCQQKSLADKVQAHKPAPPVTLHSVPTQVSPPPQPPVLVSASAQVSSPIFVARCARVSAGTQVTPHARNDNWNAVYADKHLGKVALHENHNALQIKKTNSKDTRCKKRSTLVCQGTAVSPLGAYDADRRTADHCMERSRSSPSNEQVENLTTEVIALKESPDGIEMQAAARTVAGEGRQVLGNMTNMTNKQRIQKKQLENLPVLGKSNVSSADAAVPVQSSLALKQMRPMQV
jgi:hypothetical protein